MLGSSRPAGLASRCERVGAAAGHKGAACGCVKLYAAGQWEASLLLRTAPRTYAHTHAHTHTYAHTHTHTLSLSHTHTHTHNTHTHIHTHASPPPTHTHTRTHTDKRAHACTCRTSYKPLASSSMALVPFNPAGPAADQTLPLRFIQVCVHPHCTQLLSDQGTRDTVIDEHQPQPQLQLDPCPWRARSSPASVACSGSYINVCSQTVCATGCAWVQ